MENAFDVILYIMMILQQIGDGCVQVTFFTFGYRYFFIVINSIVSTNITDKVEEIFLGVTDALKVYLPIQWHRH